MFIGSTAVWFRWVPLSRACQLFSPRTAVQFSSILTNVPLSQVPVKVSYGVRFVRHLSVSCPASFHSTYQVCTGSKQNTKIEKCSTDSVDNTQSKISQRERLKRAVKEYGAVVVVFHTCISLFTLGASYAAVSR